MVHREGRKEYDGFMSYRPLDGGDLIAVTVFEGRTEAWWIMNRNGALENLQKFYRESRGREATFRIFRAA